MGCTAPTPVSAEESDASVSICRTARPSVRHYLIQLEMTALGRAPAATTATAFADSTAVLVGGRIVLQGSREELQSRGEVMLHYGRPSHHRQPALAALRSARTQRPH